ncbi:hypothetical protein LCGC14_2751540 [marine sediment metagenome]|uniref:Uncharacterized protein n=1 Tax=marine sediment metagenome TaxID=412755 RepID=A0A0F8ZNN1_9ZZZZ
MKLGNITIKFHEEQLKRFEAAAARFPEDVLVSSSEKQAPSSVTIEVPRGEHPDRGACLCDSVHVHLSATQAGTLDRLTRSLDHGGARFRGNDGTTHLPVMSEDDAVRWLLERIGDRVRET